MSAPLQQGSDASRNLYAVTDLGTLGGDRTLVAALNNRGWTVGLSTTAEGAVRAFLHDGRVMRVLGPLPGGEESVASALNDSGQVVGVATTATGVERAVAWDGAGIPRDLGTLGGRGAYAAAINASGQIVGAAHITAEMSHRRHADTRSFIGAEDMHAFLWERGGMRDLGPPRGNHSEASDINDAGVTVGSLSTVDGVRAFIRARGDEGAMRILDPLPGGNYSAAHAIGRAGQIVGVSMQADGFLVPVLYIDGSPLPLRTLAASPIVKPLAINADRTIVGCGEVGPTDPGMTRALLWRDDDLVDLNDVAMLPQTWVLTEARGINNGGQIAANGRFGLRERAFLLSPIRISTAT